MRFENSELSLNVNNVGNTHANLTDYIAQGWSMSITGTILGRTPTPLFFVATPRTYMLQYQHHL
jgi:hypothetical protein